MQKRSLEVTCYVIGAGAFGVFFRWLQDMLAFDDAGLAEKSAFNFIVPLVLLGAAFVFNRFIKRAQDEKLYVPREFCEALFNPGRLFGVMRWLAGGITCAGAVLLMISSETDKNVEMLRALAAAGFFTGLSFPLLLGQANYDEVEHLSLVRLYATIPIAFFAIWLIVSYKENAYNSVVWNYVIEIATICVTMLAFFRVAGFAYSVVDSRKTLFTVMMGAMMCIMSLADERYMGEQIMLAGSAAMLVLYNWILFMNMKKKKPRPKDEEDEEPAEDGFEHLSAGLGRGGEK